MVSLALRVLPRRPPVIPPVIAPASQPAPAPARRALVHAGVLLLGAVLAAALFRFWKLDPAGVTLAGGGGEVPFYLWVLRWFPAAVAHGRNPLVTDFLNVPEGVNLMWNTSLILPAALLTPVTLLAGPVASYNLLLGGALALSTLSAFVAVRRFVPGDLAALAGALVYGFGPYMRAQSLGHVNLTLGAVLAPALLLRAHDVLVTQRRGPLRDGLALGALAAAQLLVAEELLATTVLTAALLAVVLAASGGLPGAAGSSRRAAARAPYALRAAGVAALLCLALAAVPLWVQFAGPYRYHGPATTETGRLVTDPAGVVVPGRLQALHTAASARFTAGLPGNDAERDAYLGGGLVLVVLVTAVAWWRRPAVRVAATMALAMLVLSLGSRLWWAGHHSRIPLPWIVPAHLPLLDSIITSRLALFTALFAGGLLAFCLERLGGVGRGRRRPALAAAVAAVALVPLVPVQASVSSVRTPSWAPGRTAGPSSAPSPR